MIVRAFIVAFAWLCATPSGWAQALPARESASTPPGRSTIQKPSPTFRTSTGGSCGLGVITSVGDKFQLSQIGLSHLWNKPTEVPIANWGLDDLAFERARAAAGPGITVVRIPDRKDPPPQNPNFTLFRDMRAELLEGMRRLTQGTNCLRYVLISKSISPLGSGRSVKGIGILDLDNPLRHQTYLFALAFVRVFDGRDLSVIQQGSALTEHIPALQRFLAGPIIFGPHREVPNDVFPSNPADAANNRAFRDGVRAMLTTSLDRTLPMMLRARTDAASR